MTWYNSFSTFELIIIVLFGLGYLMYLGRIVRVSKVLPTSKTPIIVKLILRTTVLALLIIALLGPSFGSTKREIKAIGKDIFLCIDLSQSMNAYDIQPSRLEKVKFEAKNIVNAFSSDRVGLIIFSGEAFIQSPLTFDKSALRMFIETMHTGLVPNSGTDFGPPLKLAMEKFDGDKENVTQPKSEIIILISDGEDFGEETDAIAEKVKEKGIKLFSLGVGTEEGSKIMERRSYKRDKSGNEVITKLNPDDLKDLARKTDGKYYEISKKTNEVEKLINNIQDIKGELHDARFVDVSANKYYYFLWVALGLLLLDVILNLKVIKI